MKELPKDHWNHAYLAGHDFSVLKTGHITKMLEYVHTDNKNALDIGCGTGQLTRDLYHRGFRVTGIDLAESAVQLARSATTVGDDLLTYRQLDIERDNTDTLPFPFGLITCKNVYAFITDKPAFLQRIKQLLAADGTFLIISPLTDSVDTSRQHITVDFDTTIQELKRVFSSVKTYTDAAGLTYFIATH